MRSTKRLPSGLLVPKQPVRQSTAGRSACSAALFVGSTSSTRTKVQSESHCRSTSRLKPATRIHGWVVPISSSWWRAFCTGRMASWNCRRSSHPARICAHSCQRLSTCRSAVSPHRLSTDAPSASARRLCVRCGVGRRRRCSRRSTTPRSASSCRRAPAISRPPSARSATPSTACSRVVPPSNVCQPTLLCPAVKSAIGWMRAAHAIIPSPVPGRTPGSGDTR